jgi:hypothetical protein
MKSKREHHTPQVDNPYDSMIDKREHWVNRTRRNAPASCSRWMMSIMINKRKNTFVGTSSPDRNHGQGSLNKKTWNPRQ